MKIKPDRRARILCEIEGILESKTLTAGHCAKLKGKLQCLGSSLFGRKGRAFLRALPERQYETKKDSSLTETLEYALLAWVEIVEKGLPRSIPTKQARPADAVIFTDGQADPGTTPRIGGALLAWWGPTPICFTLEVPKPLVEKWIPRKNQIMLVELLGILVALHVFGDELMGKRVLTLVDSECALDAYIKGLSKFCDIIELLSVLWQNIAEKRMIVYGDKVSTDANLSDGVSRNNFDDAKKCNWSTIKVEVPTAQSGPTLRSRSKLREGYVKTIMRHRIYVDGVGNV